MPGTGQGADLALGQARRSDKKLLLTPGRVILPLDREVLGQGALDSAWTGNCWDGKLLSRSDNARTGI